MLVFGASRADAGSLTVGWTQTLASNVAGYMISYGTVPGQYTSSVKVGNLSSYVISGLGDGTVYYFIVQAYDGSGNLSDPLQEITAVSSGTSATPSTPTNPPTISCPADITVYLPLNSTATSTTVNFSVTGSDNCGTPAITTNAPRVTSSRWVQLQLRQQLTTAMATLPRAAST